MVGHGRSSAGSYLADPTSPIPSLCASIVATSTVRVNIVCQCFYSITFFFAVQCLWYMLHCLECLQETMRNCSIYLVNTDKKILLYMSLHNIGEGGWRYLLCFSPARHFFFHGQLCQIPMKHHVKWAVSLLIADGHLHFPHRLVWIYIWSNTRIHLTETIK